ncbi:MAG: ABC transporter permease [Epsilonproteobacteria bacterium]|nr:ABC transporter permease [Campylobacterota bacterium]
MTNNLVNFIIKKYLKYDNKNPFISITALLSFFGVAIGVMVLIVAMAIMNGISKEFQDKLFTMNYPLSIYPKIDNTVSKELLIHLENKFPDMLFSPYISSQVMIQKDGMMSGGLIFGVDPKKEAKINKIYKEALVNNQKFEKYDLILGDGIKEEIGLYKGDRATVFFSSLNPNGVSMMPQMKRFHYVGSFKSGLTAYDNAYMFTSIEALQTLLQKNENYYDGIHIYSKDPMKDIEKIKQELPEFEVGVIGWWQQNGNFFSAMELEKKALFIVLMLIILIASLNIISSLLMTVMSRRKEIALLLSMGASVNETKQIFFRLGMIIGVSGILFGILLGFLGIYLLGNFDIISLPADVYGTSKLPVDLSLTDFFMIISGSFVIVLLSSYYPAHKSTKIDVLEVLRNE